MKKKLKGYIFVDDYIGGMSVTSLMHPIKEAEDGFLLGNGCKEDILLLRKIAKDAKGDLTVTADITYEQIILMRIISSIDIESIGVIKD